MQVEIIPKKTPPSPTLDALSNRDTSLNAPTHTAQPVDTSFSDELITQRSVAQSRAAGHESAELARIIRELEEI
jgi:hypothetical protein